MRAGTVDSPSSGAAAAVNSESVDEKWDWMTGLPTSVRFVAKSWRPMRRGPGGIVTDPPDSSKARTSITDHDQETERPFTHSHINESARTWSIGKVVVVFRHHPGFRTYVNLLVQMSAQSNFSI